MPDDIYTVTMINVGGPVDIKVTAIGWTPALDEAEEAAREAEIEALTEESLARGESFSGWQPPVVDHYAPLPTEPVCDEQGVCMVFTGPGEAPSFDDLMPALGLGGCESGGATSRWIVEDRFQSVWNDC